MSYGHFNYFMKSRPPFWIYFFRKCIRGLAGPPNIYWYAGGHIVQMYVSITNTEGDMIAILMISRSRSGHIGIMFWKLRGGLGPLSPLVMPMVIESKCMSLSQIQKELWSF